MTLSVEPSVSRSAPKVRVLGDIAYVSGSVVSPRQRLDLYLPEGTSGRFPVVIPNRDHRSLWTRTAEPDDELALRILTFLRAHTGAGVRSPH